MRWLTRGAAAALAAVLLAGCAAASVPAPAPPSGSVAPTVALPAGGVFLTDLGFTNAPPTFSVPASAKMLNGYNIPELINVIYAGTDGAVVHDYLMQNLAGMGFTITASSADSIVWGNDLWDGAFTMTASQAGLTLRRLG